MHNLDGHAGYFVHQINPQIGELFGISLWYYGLTYSAGFLGVYLWFKRAQKRLGWTDREIYDLSILAALGILLFGRAVEILFYEWSYYVRHPSQIVSYWRGGMASHGVLLGGSLGIWLFSRWRGRTFLDIASEVVIPGAFLMGVGRIGNFIDGQIVGSVTDVWWAVKFPGAEGFRHPVTLYDALKNFLMIPLLLGVRRNARRSRGILLAHFVFWYGFGRLFVDYYREYPVEVFGLPPGQYFNVLMALVGLGLLARFTREGRRPRAGELNAAGREDPGRSGSHAGGLAARDVTSSLWLRRLVFAALLLFPLVIPTDWTQGNTAQSEGAGEERERIDAGGLDRTSEVSYGSPRGFVLDTACGESDPAVSPLACVDCCKPACGQAGRPFPKATLSPRPVGSWET